MPGRQYDQPANSIRSFGSVAANGFHLPQDLVLYPRTRPLEPRYVAGRSISIVDGFDSGEGEGEFTVDSETYDGSNSEDVTLASAADGYRYGFNGKENDNEVKGTGNQIDFGERIYDPRLGRWLSKDPKSEALPDLTPYGFVNQNPLKFIDPDGAFLLDVHQRIATNAFNNFMLFDEKKHYTLGNVEESRDDKSYQFYLGVTGSGTIGIAGKFTTNTSGITYPDWARADVKAAHFDQMNYNQIMANMEQVQTKTSNLVANYKKGIIDENRLGFYAGQMLHAIADFYSHSNYVELYIEVYGKNSDLNSIPTLNEALSDEKYSAFAKVLPEKLVTGKYPGKGKGSHKEMNHDVGAGSSFTFIVPETRGKKVTKESRAAEAVATKATKEYLENLKTEVAKTP